MKLRKKKSLLSFALALVMALTFVPGGAIKSLAADANSVSVSVSLYDETKGDYAKNDELSGTFVTANENVASSEINIDAYWPVADGGVPADGYDTIVEYNFFSTFDSDNTQIIASGTLTVPVPEGYVGTDAILTEEAYGNCNKYFTVVSTSEDSVTLRLSDSYVLDYEAAADSEEATTNQYYLTDWLWGASTFYINLKAEGSEPDEPAEYTVTYETNGGSAVKAETVEEGKTVTKPADPTKEGYKFDGWYADKDLKTAFDFTTAINEDTTVYAKWTEDKKEDTKEDDKKEDTKEDDKKDDTKVDDKKDDTKVDDKKEVIPDVPEDAEEFATYDGRTFFETEDGDIIVTKANGEREQDEFVCDGTYTYFVQFDGTVMKDRLSYHPDGEHVIYFDEDGHEVFNDFAHVKRSIAGEEVDDYCFFDVFGHMYVDVITWDKTGTVLYYANPYGVMEMNKWFQFSDTVVWGDGTPTEGIAGGYGYATENGTLMRDQATYDWEGKPCYMQGNGVALY